jgi:hypothetical protein
MIRPLATAALLAALPAAGQDRPSDEDLFGGTASPPAQSGPAAAAPQRPSDEQILEGRVGGLSSSGPTVKEDPLKIGGLLYLRSQGQWQQGLPPSRWSLTAPSLVDGYMDVRPNDRVRGFLLARLSYDLSASTSGSSTTSLRLDDASGGSGTFLGTSLQNPTLQLDQLWVAFDVARTIFVTAGKQHVKWGVSRFWNPTDFLHPSARDPLSPFDARTGQTMLKLHVPWEKNGWNFYGMMLFDESQQAGKLGRIGAAGRVEMVLGTAEIGIDGLVQRGRDARLGIDFSAGIWDLDVYGEAALRKGTDVPRVRGVYDTYSPDDFRPSGTLGASWSYKYNDEDTFTLGAEYFYNGAGYSDSSIYPALLAQQFVDRLGHFTPFYLGKHYGGAYLLLPKPGRWNDTTFTFSAIGNFSDQTMVARLDYSVLLLTYLTFEAYVAGRFGQRGGEFRFSVPASAYPQLLSALPLQSQSLLAGTLQSLSAPPVIDFGIGLRVSL